MKLLHKLPVPFLRIWNHHSDSEKNSLPGYISPEQLIFLKKIRHHRQFVFTARILLLILFLLQWELCANAGIVDSFIFSSPSRIARCFWEMTLDQSIFLHIGITLYETLASFACVTLFSLLVAVLLWSSRKLSEILEPYLVVLNSLPKSALAPLLIVWLGVTDDVVEIRKVSDETLVGSAPDITRHFIELRGIGIVDVKSMFGVQSVRETQNIDLVITLEDWSREKEYDRLGLEEEYTEFLGNKVVCHNIPIRPGRNLAIIVESAAVNHRQKQMGYNAAQELYKRVQENLAKKRR